MQKNLLVFLYIFLTVVFVKTATAENFNKNFKGFSMPKAAIEKSDSTKNLAAIKWYFTQPGEYYFAYEHVINQKTTIEAGIGYVNKVYLPGDGFMFFGPKNTNGFSFRAHYKMYSGRMQKRLEAPFGFFHGPGFTFRYLNPEYTFYDYDTSWNVISEQTEKKIYQTATIQYSTGIQLPVFKTLTFSLFIGTGIRVKYLIHNEFLQQRHITIPGFAFSNSTRNSFLFTPVINMGASVGFFIPRR